MNLQTSSRGRPPIPLAVAMANGAILQNPSRFVGREDANTSIDHIPLGLCPAIFDGFPHCIALWREFTAEFPWLRESDRKIIELACILMADVRACFEVQAEPRSGTGETRSAGMAPNATFSQLRQILSLIGGTPSTFHRIMPPKPKDDDKAPAKKGSRYASKIQGTVQ